MSYAEPVFVTPEPLVTSFKSTDGMFELFPFSLQGEMAEILKSSVVAFINIGFASVFVMFPVDAVTVPPVPSSYKLYEISAVPAARFMLSVPVLLYKIQFVAETVPDST